ncbi:methylated-DNA--[protein]-cysteine S-methyltransferase [Muribaculum intestinale]|uniref:methylated-DNA--[protein]-cysteine S-methyltransferase n=1 Tax=Muribaculum intestinale TaxID=1796646 RepID=UPI00260D68AA|nr:methylated-DNA--[protein]-cysteine S-methyltransferase [Muribaculum intestinale]
MDRNSRITTRRYDSPCGMLMLGSYGDRLCLCDWYIERRRDYIYSRLRHLLHAEFENGNSPVIEHASGQLDEYFAGIRREFDIPLLYAGTEFQKIVWDELLGIPYGEAISYGEMAQNIGMPQAVRAVANANGANAISIFIPCHRVIGSDGSLTGYAGGLNIKEYLLNLEHTL